MVMRRLISRSTSNSRASTRRVDVRGRLVQEQQFRLAAERPGDEHPLPLAAGERGQRPPGEVVHVELAQGVEGRAAVVGGRTSPAARAARRRPDGP